MIHRDDVVSSVTALNIPPGIYNVSDDEPLTQRAFFEWLAKELDKTVPPEGEVQKRKRAETNKRVSNAKLTTDWQLKYPNFREGYGALINEEQGGTKASPYPTRNEIARSFPSQTRAGGASPMAPIAHDLAEPHVAVHIHKQRALRMATGVACSVTVGSINPVHTLLISASLWRCSSPSFCITAGMRSAVVRA